MEQQIRLSELTVQKDDRLGLSVKDFRLLKGQAWLLVVVFWMRKRVKMAFKQLNGRKRMAAASIHLLNGHIRMFTSYFVNT